MRRLSWIIFFGTLLVALLLGAAGLYLATPVPPDRDTARVYYRSTAFTDLFVTHGRQPLHEWHVIRVNGELFPACTVEYTLDGDTVLTVNRAEMQVCGPLERRP